MFPCSRPVRGMCLLALWAFVGTTPDFQGVAFAAEESQRAPDQKEVAAESDTEEAPQEEEEISAGMEQFEEGEESFQSLTADDLRALHTRIDKNKDGKASLTEVLGYAHDMGKAQASKDSAGILQELDTSKDGKLSLEEHLTEVKEELDEELSDEDKRGAKEMQDEHKRIESAKFKAADVNGDKVLDESELPGFFFPEMNKGVLSVEVQETMARQDANKDGKLTPAEFWGTSEAEETADDAKAQAADFAKLDTDGDGFLNLTELSTWESGRFHTEQALIELFRVADEDHDGHVTADELIKAREKIAAIEAQHHLIMWSRQKEL